MVPRSIPDSPHAEQLTFSHGLIIYNIVYKVNKTKCRHLKKWPVRGLCGRCFLEFIDWREIQSSWYFPFLPSFVNYIAPLTFSLVHLPPPPPHVHNNISFHFKANKGFQKPPKMSFLWFIIEQVMNYKLQVFLVICCILKENKTHRKSIAFSKPLHPAYCHLSPVWHKQCVTGKGGGECWVVVELKPYSAGV